MNVGVASKLNFSSSHSLSLCLYCRPNHMFQSQSWCDMTCTQYCKYECACVWNITWTQFVLNWRVFGVFCMCECVWDKTMIKYCIVCVYVCVRECSRYVFTANWHWSNLTGRAKVITTGDYHRCNVGKYIFDKSIFIEVPIRFLSRYRGRLYYKLEISKNK